MKTLIKALLLLNFNFKACFWIDYLTSWCNNFWTLVVININVAGWLYHEPVKVDLFICDVIKWFLRLQVLHLFSRSVSPFM